MDFKKATDELLSCVSHRELAEALKCSVATVRQSRLSEEALAKRSPPDGWERIVCRLAERQSAHFRRLAEKLREVGVR